jgi:hypothetical protein
MTFIGTTRVGKLTRSMALLLALTTGVSGCAGIVSSVCGANDGSSAYNDCRSNVVGGGVFLALLVAVAAGIALAASDDDDDGGGGGGGGTD